MALQIANPGVVRKVEQLAKASGLTKTAAVERAVDQMLRDMPNAKRANKNSSLMALLAQLDQIPDRADAFDPLEWDKDGLPK